MLIFVSRLLNRCCQFSVFIQITDPLLYGIDPGHIPILLASPSRQNLSAYDKVPFPMLNDGWKSVYMYIYWIWKLPLIIYALVSAVNLDLVHVFIGTVDSVYYAADYMFHLFYVI